MSGIIQAICLVLSKLYFWYYPSYMSDNTNIERQTLGKRDDEMAILKTLKKGLFLL